MGLVCEHRDEGTVQIVDAHSSVSRQAQEIPTKTFEPKNVTWKRREILLMEIVASGTTVTSEVYCETLKKLRGRSIQNQRRGGSSSARQHAALYRGSHKASTRAVQLELLQNGLDIKWLSSFQKDESLTGYSTLQTQRGAREWSKQLVGYRGGAVF